MLLNTELLGALVQYSYFFPLGLAVDLTWQAIDPETLLFADAGVGHVVVGEVVPSLPLEPFGVDAVLQLQVRDREKDLVPG